MNKKIKKGMITLGALASITAPIATVISCGSTQSSLDFDEDSFINGKDGRKWSELFSNLDNTGLRDQSLLSKAQYQAAFSLYTHEADGSITKQLDSFYFEQENKTVEKDGLDDEINGTLGLINLNKQLEEDKETANTDAAKAEIQVKIDKNNDLIKTKNNTIDSINSDLDTLEDKINNLIELKKQDLDKIEYDENSFLSKSDVTTSYPLLDLPFNYIMHEESKKLNDSKDNFVSKFDTAAEGQAKWPDERSSAYGGAATDEDAILYLANSVVSAKSFSRYTFKINSSYTIKQFLYANLVATHDEFSDIRSLETTKDDFVAKANFKLKSTTKIKLLDLLNENLDAINKDPNTREEDEKKTLKELYDKILKDHTEITNEKLFYLSSSSEDELWFRELVDSSDPTKGYQDSNFLENEIYKNAAKIRHGLVEAKIGATPEEGWDVTTETMLPLLKFYGTDGVQGIDLFSNPNIFDTEKTDADHKDEGNAITDVFLKNVVKKDGSVTNGGSLGYNTILGTLQTMVPGFGLGVLQLNQNKHGAIKPVVPTINLDALKQALKDEIKNQINRILGVDLDGTNPTTQVAYTTLEKNNLISTTLDRLGADSVKSIFGTVFRDEFKKLITSAPGLIYEIDGTSTKGTSNYLVFSQFGMHVIDILFGGDAASDFEKDIQKMADEQKEDTATGVISMINGHFTSLEKIKQIVDVKEDGNGNPIGDDGKIIASKEDFDEKAQPIHEAFFKTLKDRFETYNNVTDRKEEDKLYMWDVYQLIKQQSRTIQDDLISKSAGDHISKWYLEAIDNKLRDSSTVTPELLYDWIVEEAVREER